LKLEVTGLSPPKNTSAQSPFYELPSTLEIELIAAVQPDGQIPSPGRSKKWTGDSAFEIIEHTQEMDFRFITACRARL